VVKNKVAPPFKEGRIRSHLWRRDFKRGRCPRPGAEKNIVEKERNLVCVWGRTDWSGKENAKQFLKEKPKVLEQMEKEILEEFPNR